VSKPPGSGWQPSGGKAGGINRHGGGWSVPCKLITGGGQGNGQLNYPSGHEAETFTVQFDVVPPTGGASNGAYDCYALLQWTLEGNRVQRQVSVGNGVSVTGTGVGLLVTLYDISQAITSETDTSLNRPYTVNILVAPGTRASTTQLPTLKVQINWGGGPTDSPFDLNAGSSSPVIPVPQQAGVIALECVAVSDQASAQPGTAIVVPNILVICMDATGGKNYKRWNPCINTGFVAIPPNTAAVQIVNQDTLNDSVITLTWGIDG
jgi:hypothetical protein